MSCHLTGPYTVQLLLLSGNVTLTNLSSLTIPSSLIKLTLITQGPPEGFVIRSTNASESIPNSSIEFTSLPPQLDNVTMRVPERPDHINILSYLTIRGIRLDNNSRDLTLKSSVNGKISSETVTWNNPPLNIRIRLKLDYSYTLNARKGQWTLLNISLNLTKT